MKSTDIGRVEGVPGEHGREGDSGAGVRGGAAQGQTDGRHVVGAGVIEN